MQTLVEFFVGLPAPVVAAVVAAGTSMIVCLLTPWVGLGANRRLEKLKSDLVREIESTKAVLVDFNAAKNARRDYEYEARKRLYTTIEPLMFQLHEAAEQSYFRVLSLARSARLGHLEQNDSNWCTINSYYLNSTIYYLLLPAIMYKIIRKKMTLIDINLDRNISVKFYLSKMYYFSLTDDFVAAAYPPTLSYDPNAKETKSTSAAPPSTFARQALVVGDLDAFTDMLIENEGGFHTPKTFGNFDKFISDRNIDELAKEVVQLFEKFNPAQKPVLARLLIAQACLSYLIIQTFEGKSAPEQLEFDLKEFINSTDFQEDFSGLLRANESDYLFVRDYIITRLGWIPSTTPSQ